LKKLLEYTAMDSGKEPIRMNCHPRVIAKVCASRITAMNKLNISGPAAESLFCVVKIDRYWHYLDYPQIESIPEVVIV